MIKKIKRLILFIMFLNAFVYGLTQPQKVKLQNNVVSLRNNVYKIEEYNKLNFDKDVMFAQKSVKSIIVKTEAIMQKGIINKEQFIAISSTFSDQLMQSIFMNPVYFNNLKSIDWLVKKPKKADLVIKLVFEKNGIRVMMKSNNREEKEFVPYDELFHQRMKP